MDHERLGAVDVCNVWICGAGGEEGNCGRSLGDGQQQNVNRTKNKTKGNSTLFYRPRDDQSEQSVGKNPNEKQHNSILHTYG